MKKLLLLVLCLVLSGCASIYEPKTIICERETQLIGTTYASMRTSIELEGDFIKQMHIQFRIDVDEDEIKNDFDGDRVLWLEFLERYFEIIYEQAGSNLQIQDLGDILIVDDIVHNGERPQGWRGWIVPKEKRLDPRGMRMMGCEE